MKRPPLFNTVNRKYFIQCLMIYCFISLVLFFMGSILEKDVLSAVGVSAIAASTFLVFCIPNASASHCKKLIGGYLVGLLLGMAGYFIIHHANIFQTHITHYITFVIWGGFTVGITSLIMAIFNVEHPPAAGLALGLAYERWENHVIIVIVISILCLCLIRYLLKDYLISLL